MCIVDDINAYLVGYREFRKITAAPANRNTGSRYRKFLGMPQDVMPGGWLRSKSDDDRAPIIDRAKQLSGPHGYAIYKAWRAKHGTR